MLSEGSLNLLLKDRLASFARCYMFWDRSVDPMIRGSLCNFSVIVLLFGALIGISCLWLEHCRSPQSGTVQGSASRKDKPIPRLGICSWEVEFLAFLKWEVLYIVNIINLLPSGLFYNSAVVDIPLC